MLRDLRDRGLQPPRLGIGDGGLGLWAALQEVFPTTEHQRCWNHRALNVLDVLPQRLWPEARGRLAEIVQADAQAECERLREASAAALRAQGQAKAAETLLRDWEAFVTFSRYPKEHWLHLRTSNPIESLCSGVRLRTNATNRLRQRENALELVGKIVERLSQRWRALNGGRNLLPLVLEGCVFKDGVLQPRAAPRSAEAA